MDMHVDPEASKLWQQPCSLAASEEAALLLFLLFSRGSEMQQLLALIDREILSITTHSP